MALTTLGLMSRIQVNPACFFQFICFECLHRLLSASVSPRITNKQEAFIRWVIEIPLDERKCRDLITLDTLQAYCGGPEPTPKARRLNAYSRRCKFIRFNPSFLFFRRLV